VPTDSTCKGDDKREGIETKMDCIQEKKDANLKEIIVEMKDRRKEKTAGQEAMETNPEKMEPTECAIVILEMMEITDLKANLKEMESESGYQEISKKEAVKERKKRHSDRHLAAGRP
jgi:hypothetical protein